MIETSPPRLVAEIRRQGDRYLVSFPGPDENHRLKAERPMGEGCQLKTDRAEGPPLSWSFGDVVRAFGSGSVPKIDGLTADAQQLLLGEFLTECLLGDSAQQSELLLRYLGPAERGSERFPNALTAPIALEIRTSEPEVLNLPWYAMAWCGRPLWERGTTVAANPTGRAPGGTAVLNMPCCLLFVGPGTGPADELGTDDHFRRLLAWLGRVSSAYARSDQPFVRRVKRIEELQPWLHRMEPTIIYWYGHCAADASCRPALCFGKDSMPVARLGLMIDKLREKPVVVYLNGFGTGAGRRASGGNQLLSSVPAVVSHVAPPFSHRARLQAYAFFDGLLRQGLDPVSAVAHSIRTAEIAGTPWPFVLPFARYTRWTHRGSVRPSGGDAREIALSLDRLKQRHAAESAFRSLLKGDVPGTRCLCLVWHGLSGNHVELFGDQLRRELAHCFRDEARFVSLPGLDLPSHGVSTREALKYKLEKSIEADPPDVLVRHQLREKLYEQGVTDADFFWLDCGSYPRDEVPAIDDGQVTEWLEFLKCDLLPELPDHTCAVIVLGREFHDAPALNVANEAFERLQDRYHTTELVVELLDPLADASRRDLKKLFVQHPDDAPPRDDWNRVVEALLHRSGGGRYAELFKLIVGAIKSGWFSVLEPEPRSTPATSDPQTGTAAAPPGPKLTLSALRDAEVLAELASVYFNRTSAYQLVEPLGYDRGSLPWIGDSPLEWWYEIVRVIERDDKLDALLAAARKAHPGNRRFQRFSTGKGE